MHKSDELPEEIERRFLPYTVPPFDELETQHIEQPYLAIKDGREVRIRSVDGMHYLTVKLGSGVQRKELEELIDAGLYEKLAAFREGILVVKDRAPLDPPSPEAAKVNLFRNELQDLVTIEIEFGSREEEAAFSPPESFGIDVTHDVRFQSGNLALLPGPVREVRGHVLSLMAEVRGDAPAESRLEEGIPMLVGRVIQLVRSLGRPVIVQVAGGSATGKTSRVSERLAEELATAGITSAILSQDHYYRGGEHMRESAERGVELNFDQPQVIDLELYGEHLAELKTGATVQRPVYSYRDGGTREGYEPFTPPQVVIAEGLFTLRPEVLAEGDLGVFVETSAHGSLIRRVMRDKARTGQTPLQIMRQYLTTVKPMYDLYVATTKRMSQISLTNEYHPGIESLRAGEGEYQRKFRADITEEQLLALGGRRLGMSDQRDSFFNPIGQDLRTTSELLRIRDERGTKSFTYKGPHTLEEDPRRPCIPSPLDNETADIFLSLYPENWGELTKERTFFHLPKVNAVVCLDRKIERRIDGVVSALDDHVEIQADTPAAFLAVCRLLGLDPSQAIQRSYIEMG